MKTEATNSSGLLSVLLFLLVFAAIAVRLSLNNSSPLIQASPKIEFLNSNRNDLAVSQISESPVSVVGPQNQIMIHRVPISDSQSVPPS